MWLFVSVVSVEFRWGWWVARILLEKEGRQESTLVKFKEQPTIPQVEGEGARIADRRNVEEAPVGLGRVVSLEEFVGRFSLSEIADIYAAAQSNPALLAYTKKLEMRSVVYLDSPDVVGGLSMLEQAGLLGQNRAAAIRES